jgi:hypothetical protein
LLDISRKPQQDYIKKSNARAAIGSTVRIFDWSRCPLHLTTANLLLASSAVIPYYKNRADPKFNLNLSGDSMPFAASGARYVISPPMRETLLLSLSLSLIKKV